MRMSFAATFASPTLRCIELADQIFKDAVELQLLLGSSMALTELGLQSVTFADTSRKTASGKARVVLVTLKLRFMEAPVIECMLDSFTAVDITHLKTLELIGTPVTDLLTANSTSLVDVQIKLYNEGQPTSDSPRMMNDGRIDLYSLGTPFPRDGAAVLHSLHLNAYRTSSIATMLANFGWLHYFKALKTLTLSIRSGNHPTDEDVWAYMDREWGRHGILEWVEVNIYGGCEGVDTKLREWLPCTNQRGILNIHTVTGNMF
jgi:hypothetical protein